MRICPPDRNISPNAAFSPSIAGHVWQVIAFISIAGAASGAALRMGPVPAILGAHAGSPGTPSRVERADGAERALARDFPQHRRRLSRPRRTGRLPSSVADAADVAVARLGSQRDAGSRGAWPHLRPARERRAPADPAGPQAVRRRAARIRGFGTRGA